MAFDVVIVGGGPAGLAAALALGRARKRVLLCDAGPRRNAAATHINNFVTRDGTPPEEFRSIARQQLLRYPNVQVREERVIAISGQRGAFDVALTGAAVQARRILLGTGMIDEMLPIEGFPELWGRSIFQCPYCHGWESQDQRWGYLARAEMAAHFLPFSLQALAWTQHLVVFTNSSFEVPKQDRLQLEAAGIQIETEPVARLVRQQDQLAAVELANGQQVRCELLFTAPPQQQVALIKSLDLAVDGEGFVQVDPMRRETSKPGIYASGDLTTRMQGAIMAAAAGTQAAAMINLDLMMETR